MDPESRLGLFFLLLIVGSTLMGMCALLWAVYLIGHYGLHKPLADLKKFNIIYSLVLLTIFVIENIAGYFFSYKT